MEEVRDASGRVISREYAAPLELFRFSLRSAEKWAEEKRRGAEAARRQFVARKVV